MFTYTESSYSRYSRSRGRILGTGSPYGVAYPSPFFDVAHTYLPDTIRRMFQWCRYYYLTNPVIAAVVNKMAEYPITDLIVEAEDPGVVSHWRGFLDDQLRIRSFLIDLGLYYMCYGNAIVSISYPFEKFLECGHCRSRFPIRTVHYRFHGFRFMLECPKCQRYGEAHAEDVTVAAPNRIRLLLWIPEDVTVNHNEITGDTQYFYDVPRQLKNDIMLGIPRVIESMPQLVIDSVRRGKMIRLSYDNVFHARRPSILGGGRDSGVGIPLLLPVLKDTFYLQLLKKANETIALEAIYPMRVVFPQGMQTLEAFQSIDLTKWRDQIQREISRWRIDRAYIPILPLPIGQEVIGGDGRSLMLTQEIKMWSDQIIAGMGVPGELIYGGLSWSGSNVSLRMLENHFLRYLSTLRVFIRKFVINNIAAFLDWPTVDVRFKPFKMADDLQRRALMFQYSQAGKISDRTLLSDADLDPDKEIELILDETRIRTEAIKQQQLAQAEIQGEMQVVMARYQARAQAVMLQEQQQAQSGNEESGPGETQEGIASGRPAATGQQMSNASQVTPGIVNNIVGQLKQMPAENQQMMLQQIGQQSPDLAGAVANSLRPAASAGAELPNQLPPRRGPEAASI